MYDIVNGKTQAISLETLDKLLDGLEQLTGERMTVSDLLTRDTHSQTTDPALLAQLGDLPAFDFKTLKAALPTWTAAERDENDQFWLAQENDRRMRGDKRQQRLDMLWEENQETPSEQRPA